jgi:hypothetical protein
MGKDQYLAGKLAIVTGSGKPNGIGAATAYALAEHGANVSLSRANAGSMPLPAPRPFLFPCWKCMGHGTNEGE